MKIIQPLILMSPVIALTPLLAHVGLDNEDTSITMEFSMEGDTTSELPVSNENPQATTDTSGNTAPCYQFPEYKEASSNKTTPSSVTPSTGSSSVEIGYQQSGFHVTAQILYWQTVEDNLAYAIYQPSNASSVNPNVMSLIGRLKENGYRWDPGIRVGGGYLFATDTVDANIEYTYFHNEGGRAKSVSAGHDIQGVFPDNLPGQIDRVTSSVRLQYHVLDLYFTHIIHTAPHFLLKFLFGGRGAWISQGWRVKYGTPTPLYYFVYSPIIDVETHVKNNWKFSGGGIRGGLLFDWFLPWGFNIHFEGTGSGILGWFNNQHQISQTTGQKIAKIHPKNTRIVPNVQLLLGLGWRKTFSDYTFQFFGAWEMNMWSRLSQTYYYPTASLTSAKVGSWVRDSINIQGLTTGVNIEF